jgi:hypothetical protein
MNIATGTIISLSQDTNTPFGAPVMNRLRVRDTVLRSSGDASLLLESLLDLSTCTDTRSRPFDLILIPRLATVVDNAVQVADKYHDVILKMERSILLKPNMKTVRGRGCSLALACFVVLTVSCS